MHKRRITNNCPLPALLALVAAMQFGAGVFADCTLYVDDDAPNDPGPHDSSISDPAEDGSIDHPFDMIQEALDAATDGMTIIVNAGAYHETIDLLGKLVHLRSAEGAAATIIDGANPDDDLPETAPLIRCVNGETRDTIIDGFTIRDGNYLDGENFDGSGMHIRAASPTIRNCAFVRNRAYGDGGAIFCSEGASPRIISSLFAGNTAKFGGAIASDNNCPAETINCTFADNHAFEGHAVYAGGVIQNSILWNQMPSKGSSMLLGSPTVSDSIVQGGWPGINVLNIDPQFADGDGADDDPTSIDDNNYRLGTGSPAIDLGVNAALPDGLPIDLDRNLRFIGGAG